MEGAAPDADAEPEAEPDAKEAEDARKLQARITRLNREKWEAKRDATAAQARLDEMQRQWQAQQPQQPGQPPNDAVEEAKRQLRVEQHQRDFNAACNAAYKAGLDEYGEAGFKDSVAALNAVGAGSRTDFLEAVTQIPDGHRLYPLLAADLDNAGRILALPPTRMAVELAKLALKAEPPAANGHDDEDEPEKPAPVSRAPAPIKPIRGASRNPNPASEIDVGIYQAARSRREREAADLAPAVS